MKKTIAIVLLTTIFLSSVFCVPTFAQGSAPEITYCYNSINGPTIEWTSSLKDNVNVYRRAAGEPYFKCISKNIKTNYYTDTSCKHNTYYAYFIKTIDDNDYVKNSESRLIKYVQTPTFTNIYNHVYGMALVWEKLPMVNYYKIYRRMPHDDYWTFLGNTTNDYFIDASVKNSEQYKYTIRAVSDYWSGFDSNGSYVKCIRTPQIASSYNIKSGVNTYWTKNTEADSYRVYRRGAGNFNWKYLGETQNTYFVDDSAKNDAFWRYTVIAVSNETWSDFIRDGVYTKRVSTPTIIVKNNEDYNSIQWDEIIGATQYNLYRKVNNETNWHFIKSSSNTLIVDNNITKNNKYTYCVRAINNGYYSDTSNIETVDLTISEYYPSLTAEDMKELERDAIAYIKSKGGKVNMELTYGQAGFSYEVGLTDDLTQYGNRFKRNGGIRPLDFAKGKMRETIDSEMAERERLGISEYVSYRPWVYKNEEAGAWRWVLLYG